jgi:kynurenine formamidase
MREALLATAFVVALAGAALGGEAKRLLDLTYAFEESTLHWPTAKPFKLEKAHEGRTPQGFWYASYDYSASEHVGTHLDSPFHFAEGRWTTDQIPLDRLIGPAVVIDVSRSAAKDRDYLLQPSDIARWEKRHGRLARGVIVLIRTGWGRYWGDRKAYFGSDAPGDVENLHFPGVSREAAELLVRRGVRAVGIDTPSIDHGPSRDFIAHRIFGEANVPVFENVANLDRLPAEGARVYAIPMKIKGGSGAPLRIFAELPRAVSR